jgi:hypothetical protein
MNKLLFILCSILIAVPSYGRVCFVGGGGTASEGAACNAATNDIGDRTTTYGDWVDVASGGVACMQYTADCSGTFGYGYIVHDSTGNDNGKICLYSDGDGDTNADSSDLLLGCSAEFSSNTDGEVVKTSGKFSIAASNGVRYWICIAGGAGSFRFERATYDVGLKTFWYLSSGWNYASPPANLSASWSTDTLNEFAVYVEIE